MSKKVKTVLSTIIAVVLSSSLVMAGGYFVLKPILSNNEDNSWTTFLEQSQAENFKNIVKGDPPVNWDIVNDSIYQVSDKVIDRGHSVSVTIGDLNQRTTTVFEIPYHGNVIYDVSNWASQPVVDWDFGSFALNATNNVNKGDTNNNIKKLIEHLHPSGFNENNVNQITWRLILHSWKVNYDYKTATGSIVCSPEVQDSQSQQWYIWNLKTVYSEVDKTRYNIDGWKVKNHDSDLNWTTFLNAAKKETLANIAGISTPSKWNPIADGVMNVAEEVVVAKKSIKVTIGDYPWSEQATWTIQYHNYLNYDIRGWVRGNVSAWAYPGFCFAGYPDISGWSTHDSGPRGIIEHLKPANFESINVDNGSWAIATNITRDYDFHSQTGWIKFSAKVQDLLTKQWYIWHLRINYSEADRTVYNINNWKLDSANANNDSIYFINRANTEPIKAIANSVAPDGWKPEDTVAQLSTRTIIDNKTVTVTIGNLTKFQKAVFIITYQENAKYDIKYWTANNIEDWSFSNFWQSATNEVNTKSTSKTTGVRGIINAVIPNGFRDGDYATDGWKLDNPATWSFDENSGTAQISCHVTALFAYTPASTHWIITIMYYELDHTKYDIHNWSAVQP